MKSTINKLIILLLFHIVWTDDQLPRLCVHTTGASYDALAHAHAGDAHD